jgi:hypothetical protein
VEKLEALCIIAKNVKCSSLCGKQYGSSSKKQKSEMLYDPAVPLLGI